MRNSLRFDRLPAFLEVFVEYLFSGHYGLDLVKVSGGLLGSGHTPKKAKSERRGMTIHPFGITQSAEFGGLVFNREVERRAMVSSSPFFAILVLFVFDILCVNYPTLHAFAVLNTDWRVRIAEFAVSVARDCRGRSGLRVPALHIRVK